MAIEFLERCDAIEECYEFMLAYAARDCPAMKVVALEAGSAIFCGGRLSRWQDSRTAMHRL